MTIKIIIKILKKTWYLFLIPIVYMAVAFTNLLPPQFNLFKKNEVKLIETPVLIKEIKEIGELVCAEYYGEVYADLFEAYDDVLADTIGKDSLYFDRMFVKYKYLEEYKKRIDGKSENEELNRAEEEVLNLREQKKLISNANDSLKTEIDSLEQQLSKLKKRKEKKEVTKKINEINKQRKVKVKELRTVNKKIELAEKTFMEIKEDLNSKDRKIADFIKNNNIVYLGRGKVIAGMDLMVLHDNSIDTLSTDTLRVKIPQPSLLDTIINPWFIRYKEDLLGNNDDKKKGKKSKKEKGVYGYEVIIAKKKNYSYDDIKLVKNKCLTKLADAAISRNTIEMAETTATDVLVSFFSLMGYSEIIIEFEASGNTNLPAQQN